MRIVRYNAEKQQPTYGIVEEDSIYELIGSILGNFKIGKKVGLVSSYQLLAPCTPTKIVCAAVNFPGTSHFESNMEEPLFFVKPATSVTGPDSIISNPFPGKRWWGEAELGIVIKHQMKNVSEENVKDYVLGATIGNDITIDNCDDRDHHLLRSKGVDNFCPLGPWIETDINQKSWNIEAIQYGKVIRRGNTKNQFWQWEKILSSLSKWITLEPMDVVLTGNPPSISSDKFIEGPTEFIARIENIGDLRTFFI